MKGCRGPFPVFLMALNVLLISQMLFSRPVSGSGKALHSSHCMLIPAVRVMITAYDVDCTCFVSESFIQFTYIIHIIKK